MTEWQIITGDCWVNLARSQQERFWKHVRRTDGCWNWQGGCSPDGYGKFAVTAPRGATPKQKHFRAHRLSYQLLHGYIHADLVVRHDCDNPLCVNPSHLRLGTQRENIQDCIRRGRFPRDHVPLASRRRGSSHHAAKITEALAFEIKSLAASGMRQAAIGRLLHVRARLVQQVVSGTTWRHV